jgi:hypothetical protein
LILSKNIPDRLKAGVRFAGNQQKFQMTLPPILAGRIEAIIVTVGMRELLTAALEFVFAATTPKSFYMEVTENVPCSKLLSWVIEST